MKRATGTGWRARTMLVAAVASAGACGRLEGCRRGAFVAELVNKQGVVERNTPANASLWAGIDPGQRFYLGDAVRAGAASQGRIRLAGGGAFTIGAGGLVRFSARRGPGTAPGAMALRVETGEVEVEGEGGEIVIETSLGVLRVERGARGRLRAPGAPGGETRFEVAVGSVVLERVGGVPVRAEAGQQLRIELAGVFVEPAEASAVPSAIPSAVPSAAPSAAPSVVASAIPSVAPSVVASATPSATSSSGATPSVSADPSAAPAATASAAPAVATANARLLPGPSAGASASAAPSAVTNVEPSAAPDVPASLSANSTLAPATHVPDVEVSMSGSVTVHATRLPVHVRVGVGASCPAGAVVSAGRVSPSGAAGGVLELPEGSHRVTVRCIEGGRLTARAVATASVRVRRDSGAASMPASAPRTSVDLDGRNYSVLYQNLLPVLNVRWPGAPASAQSFELTMRPTSGGASSITLRGNSPEITVPSGRAAEGTYALQMSAGGAHSQSTGVRIEFDNAAPAAQIREPSAGSITPGATVSVSGVVTIANSSVRVNEADVPLDGQLRFRTEATAPAQGSLVIRISSPRQGVHYYLRAVGP